MAAAAKLVCDVAIVLAIADEQRSNQSKSNLSSMNSSSIFECTRERLVEVWMYLASQRALCGGDSRGAVNAGGVRLRALFFLR
jgi:hypothetical protein